MKKINYSTYQKPSRFVKLDQGDNRLRIVSDGVTSYEHGMLTGNGYVPLGPCTENVSCEHCMKGMEPSLKFKWIVYLPQLKDVKVLSVSSRVGDEICVIAKREKLSTFEVIINKVGVGRQAKYKVKKAESTPMDKETVLLIKDARDYLYQKYLTA